MNFEELRELYKLSENMIDNIKTSKLNPEQIRLTKESTIKNLMIAIYSTWEKTIKTLTFNQYLTYRFLFDHDEFYNRFVGAAVQKNHSKNELIKRMNKNIINVTKEVFCFSNNLTLEELESIFKKMLFSKDRFTQYFENNYLETDIIETLNELEKVGLLPILQSKNTNNYNKISGYLKVLINNRNKVSHEYSMEESITIEQVKLLIDLIEKLIEHIELFYKEEIILQINEEIEELNEEIEELNEEIEELNEEIEELNEEIEELNEETEELNEETEELNEEIEELNQQIDLIKEKLGNIGIIKHISVDSIFKGSSKKEPLILVGIENNSIDINLEDILFVKNKSSEFKSLKVIGLKKYEDKVDEIGTSVSSVNSEDERISLKLKVYTSIKRENKDLKLYKLYGKGF